MGSCSKVTLDEISIIIPVKDNQQGVNHFLDSFFQTHQLKDFPREIIVVDNNSAIPVFIPEEYAKRSITIQLLTCDKPGPASARNVGAKHAKGKWLLFVDSDCISTESMIKGYLTEEGSAVGYQGFVAALGNDYVSKYYESQQIHKPPSEASGLPNHIITANVLILKEAFNKINGFDETFNLAGGEDIDLGLRLSKVGELAYTPGSVILHEFNDGLTGFVKRFIRYGRGNRLVREFHKVSLVPLPSTAKKKSVLINNFLVILQWLCLLSGYTLEGIKLLRRSSSIVKDHSKTALNANQTINE